MHLIALLVNVVLVFLPFNDSNNTALVIATASHFTSNAPPSTLSLWVAGPFINAMYVPGYLAYLLSGFQIYWAYTIYKVIFFALSTTLALVLYHLVERTDKPTADRIALFVIANPAWLFVTYIWDQYHIFPVVLFAAVYILLRYVPPVRNDSLRIVAVTTLLLMSIFLYWFALVLIPTLFLYTREARERFRLFISLVVGIPFMFLIDFWLFAGTSFTSATTLLGVAKLNATQVFGLQYFVPLSPTEYGLFLVGLALLFPFLLKQFRFDEPSTSFILVTLLLFSAPFVLPDNYILVFPFAAFIIINRLPSRTSWASMYALLAYPIAGLLMVNFYIGNAEPDGAGIFYWGYDLFHANVTFIHSYAAQQEFVGVFNGVMACAVTGSLLVLLSLRPSNGHKTGRAVAPVRASTHARGLRRTHLATGGAVLGCLVVASLLFNACLPNAVQYFGSGTPPIYILTPLNWPNDGNVPRPIEDATYGVKGNVMEVYAAAPPIVFGRWFAGQSLAFAGDVSFSGPVPPVTTFLNGTPYSASLLNSSRPDASRAGTLVGKVENRVVNVSLGYALLNRTTTGSYLDGNASIVYTLNDTALLGGYFVFAFNMSTPGTLQTNLFHLEDSHNFVALVSYPDKTVLVYGGTATDGAFVEIAVPAVVSPGSWNYVEFDSTSASFSLTLNGARAVVPLGLFVTGTDSLRIGVPFAGGEQRYSLTGTVTPVYFSQVPYVTDPSYVVELVMPGATVARAVPSPSFDISLTSNLGVTELQLAGMKYAVDIPTQAFYVGKFMRGGYSFVLQLDRFSMNQSAPNNYFLVPIFASFVSPYIALGVCLRWRWAEIPPSRLSGRHE